MVKPEWGTKRTCQSCGAKYYDMLRDPIICPRCETEYVEPAPITSRRGRSAKASRIPEPKEEKIKDTENSDEEILAAVLDPTIEESEDSEPLIEDTSDLNEDDDDVAIVIDSLDTKENPDT